MQEYGPVTTEPAGAVRRKAHCVDRVKLTDVDDQIAELFISEVQPGTENLVAAIRRQTVLRRFVRVFMGSA